MRVAVFIDWENVTRGAQRAFDFPEHAVVSPLAVGSLLARGHDRREHGELVLVDVHRGLPSANREPDLHAAAWRLSVRWLQETEGIVIPRLRPLRYRKNQDGVIRGEEKGIDVQLAASAIRWVLKNECEVAVIFSHDSDMSPVVEMLAEVEGSQCIETASWFSSHHLQRIPEHADVFNHYLTKEDFEAVSSH